MLFDTGLSPDAMIINADRLGLNLSGVHALVLSHGHFDHAGGLARLARRPAATTNRIGRLRDPDRSHVLCHVPRDHRNQEM